MNKSTNLLLALLILGACSPSKKNTDETDTTDQPEAKTAKIELSKAPESPQYPGASLGWSGQGETSKKVLGKVVDSNVNYFFDVENFELGAQTTDAATRGIANSDKGQHIHFIVNNGPYSAHYMSDINSELDPGNYTVLAFLSRSYHESVKEPGAYHVENLTVGDVEPEEVDLSTPHLFFSRPKGTYSGADTEKVMLDFYLLNCDLSPDGFNVKATINGQEFLIDEWAPYYMTGLPKGEIKIKLELLDSEGQLVDSPYNPVERTVTLAE